MLFQMLLAVIAAGGGLHATPTKAHTDQPTACATPTEGGQRRVEDFTGRGLYEKSRAELGVPRTSPEQVRLLTNALDADACMRMRDAFEQQARRLGGTARGLPLEFYQVGAFYYVVRSVPQSTCKPGPRHACIDLRWWGFHIFDKDFNRLKSIRF